MNSSDLNFDADGFYILLFDLGDSYRFHWGLYLAKSPDEGIIFQVINEGNTTTWIYDSKSINPVHHSQRLILALKVAVIEPILHDALGDRLAQIPIEYSARFREDITCRVWVKEALFALDEGGYLNLTTSVDAVENEARSLAIKNKYLNQQSVIKSAGSCV